MAETNMKICSILSASLCTYGIDEPGGVEGVALAPDVGFIKNSVVTFTAGTKEIDACYVADTADSVILAFRGTSLGTDQQAFVDWLNNFLAKPVEIDGIPGELHDGFSDSVQRLWDQGFQNEVEKRMAGGKPLIITGYSKGAALAPIAAAFLKEKKNIEADSMNIYIFEPPRPGNAKFAKYFNNTFPGTVRYEYQDDIVPHVPPIETVSDLLAEIPFLGNILDKFVDIDEWNYKSVGKLKFVNWKNKIVDSSPFLSWYRYSHLVELIITGEPEEMFLDHLPQERLYPVLCGKPWPKETKLTF